MKGSAASSAAATAASSSAEQGSERRGLVVADPATVAFVRGALPSLTRQVFQDHGLSETTWTKLRDGRPLKRATLERILRRLSAAQAADLGGATES